MTGWRILPRLALAVAIAGAAIWLALNQDSLDPARIESSIRDLGPWGPVGHVVLFAVGTVLFLPGAVFGLAGGLLFGPLWGTILNLIGATLGAIAAFLVGRYLAGDWVRRRAGPRLERLVAGVEAEGWRFVAFVRLVPLFPFNLSNYAFGLTRISLTHYVLATLVCMLPGTLAFTWLGHAGREAAAGNSTAIRYALIALALLAAIAFLPRLMRRLRGREETRWIEVDELANRLEASDIAVIDVRGPDEFIGPLGHIAIASSMPIGALPQRLTEIKALKDKPVILVCGTDKRSASAAALLLGAGFRDVRVLHGGMEQWNRSGLPVNDRAAVGPA
ncbi:MAG: VTT domain-containing protein [Rhodospirillales bacterium]|nr:VTT domain-containing protein [Rhodospirillales bacterium]